MSSRSAPLCAGAATQVAAPLQRVVLVLCLLAAGCPSKCPSGDEGSRRQAAKGDEPASANVVERGDLKALRQRGELRVLVFNDGESFLPRGGTPDAYERELARELAEELKLKPRFVRAPSFDALFSLLLEGKGDIVAARVTVTDARAKRVAFTRPVKTVSEVVVGKKGAADLPRAIAQLAGRTVHVRESSSYAESLRALPPKTRPDVVGVPDHLDDEQVVHRVSTGELPLTVVDSDLAEAILTYNDDVEVLFPLVTGREIAWAVRPSNPVLKQKADAFLMEHALTSHTRELFQGDLAGIQERGVLRVLTRNGPLTYFLHRGRQYGFDYELAQMMAEELGVRLEMVVPERAEELIPWLKEGRGDVIAAAFTVTEQREREVAFSTPYLFVDEVLVLPAGTPGPSRVEELAELAVHVRPSSSYRATLLELQEEVALEIVPVDESLGTGQLIDAVAAGELPATVADENIVAAELTWRDDIRAGLALTSAEEGAKDPLGKRRSGAKEIAFATRKDAKQLQAWLDSFVKEHYRGVRYNVAKKRYFEDKKVIASAREERFAVSGELSPYDELLKKYGARYGIDWRLLAAQAFQESRFDPNAESWAGARGLFQVMPDTAAEMGFTDLMDPEVSVHAGVRYLARMMEQLEDGLDFRQRVRFALASYNVGRGHLLDARRLAKQKGWDEDRWFGHVERAMLLLKEPRYAAHARHGYCRGDEPVQYVSKIQARYDTYVELVPESRSEE